MFFTCFGNMLLKKNIDSLVLFYINSVNWTEIYDKTVMTYGKMCYKKCFMKE